MRVVAEASTNGHKSILDATENQLLKSEIKKDKKKNKDKNKK